MKSICLMVGAGKCNAHCLYCAGVPHRRHAPLGDGEIPEDLFSRTLMYSWFQGARSLTISSSGEPTLSPLSVTMTLRLAAAMARDGMAFDRINLYTNGIRIGDNAAFCSLYLPIWKSLGLNYVYVTVHSIEDSKNAKGFGVASCPTLATIFKRIHAAGLAVRANLPLSKEGTLADFMMTACFLRGIGADAISAWPIRGVDDDKVDPELAPSEEALGEMGAWAESWGRTNKFDIRVLTSRAAYEKGDKMTLFPNGSLSNKWC